LLAGSRDSDLREPAGSTDQLKTWRNFLAIHDLRLGLERWQA
jgi:hypothetical protein